MRLQLLVLATCLVAGATHAEAGTRASGRRLLKPRTWFHKNPSRPPAAVPTTTTTLRPAAKTTASPPVTQAAEPTEPTVLAKPVAHTTPAPSAPFEPHVFNMMGMQGQFETRPIGSNRRSVGFWSYRTPRVGDMLVRPGANGTKTVWVIESVAHDFTGSNGDKYWKGTMRDLIGSNTMTENHWAALDSAARTQPSLR